MKKHAVLYVHGQGGSSAEADFYKPLCPDYDVIGLSFADFTPAGTKETLQEAYHSLSKEYESISLIANSIGAFFSMLWLQEYPLQKAYLISPVLDMEGLILGMMKYHGVSEEQLKQEGTITAENGDVMDYAYLTFVREHPITWKIPTEILYAGNDFLTPRSVVDAFVESHDCGLCVMEDGEHWFHTPEQLAFLSAWLQKVLL